MNDKKIAHSIKSYIVDSCTYVSDADIKITVDKAHFHGYKDKSGFVNRNASSGEEAYWVLIEIPQIPTIESDSYYQKNPHLNKPTKESKNKIKNQVKMIEAVCRQAAKQYKADYIGYNTESVGFDTSNGNTTYLNIRVN